MRALPTAALLLALLASAGRAAADPPAPPTAAPVSTIDWRALQVAGVVMVATGVTASVAGIVVAAETKNDTIESVGLGLSIGGGLVALAGLVVLVQTRDRVSSAPPRFTVAPAVARGGGGLALGGTF